MSTCDICQGKNMVSLYDTMEHITLSEQRDCPDCGYHYLYDTGSTLESIGWLTLYGDKHLTIHLPWIDRNGRVWYEKNIKPVGLFDLLLRLFELYYSFKARFTR